MADEKDAKEKEAAPAAPKKILGMPLPQLAFAVLNLIVVLGGLAYTIQISLLYKKPAITESQVQEEIKKKLVKKVEPENGFFTESYSELIINLKGQQGGKPHFVQTEVAIACGSEKCLQQIKENKAKVLDAIQTVISQRSFTELGSLEAKFRIKHEIQTMVNSWLKDTAVTDVLFTTFLVM